MDNKIFVFLLYIEITKKKKKKHFQLSTSNLNPIVDIVYSKSSTNYVVMNQQSQPYR